MNEGCDEGRGPVPLLEDGSAQRAGTLQNL